MSDIGKRSKNALKNHKLLAAAVIIVAIAALLIITMDVITALQVRKLNQEMGNGPVSHLTASSSQAAKPFSIKISPQEITHGDKTKKQVIFTFDGGDGAQSGLKILDVLNKHRVRGTFFLTGKFVEANPALVRTMAAGNNEIFNHTYDHPHLTSLSAEKIVAELAGMENVLESVASTMPKPFMRMPYGDRDARVENIVADAGYQSVYWTVDALDWEQPQGETADEVENRIISKVAPGNIYLMHIGDDITGEILDRVFTKIENEGYKIVSLTQGITH